jgi:hypothetical protein
VTGLTGLQTLGCVDATMIRKIDSALGLGPSLPQRTGDDRLHGVLWSA